MSIKKVFIFCFLLVLFSCSSKSDNNKFVHSAPDTIRTLALYMRGPGKPMYDVVFRVSKDSFMFSLMDSTTLKKSWVRAKDYYIPIVDTVRNADGSLGLDSIGRPKIATQYILINSAAVIKDMDIDLDSIIKMQKK